MFIDHDHDHDRQRQRQRLAVARGGAGVFTVNSSNHAVPVYEAFGFVRTEPMQFAKGLYYNPMRLAPPGPASDRMLLAAREQH